MNYRKKAILMVVALFCLNIAMLAQAVSLKMNNVSVKEAMTQLKNKSGYSFVYKVGDLDTKKIVNVKAKQLIEAIDQILYGQNVVYEVKGKNIIVQKGQPRPKEVKDSKKRKITGVVNDQNGEPIIGATVKEKGGVNGTATDLDAKFALEVSPGAVLEISYIGYASVEVKVGNQTSVKVMLKEDSEILGEVVVTALGIKREEKALGYAVQKVGGDKLTTAKGVDVASTLTGKIAGLNIQNSTEFNEGAKILLRGETPIVIVDGIPYDNVGLDDIAPDDIESIDVLKGATASALYGSRGASGAIMITTKRGAEEEGLNVSVNSNTMFFSGYLAFPETQSSYSRGQSGVYGESGYIWGDKLDIGRTAIHYNPYTYEWEEQELTSKGKNNYKNFLQFSFVTNNNVSVTQKGKYGSFR
ncbi:TonB-dependent receptor plug domain-containing protein, partial [Bacteroides acidifaciens]|uniref:TonB-dependent receptor plug domain-containing protein n=2 Tax=Bacteroides TaxID=816 RepID=UPI00248C55AD